MLACIAGMGSVAQAMPTPRKGSSRPPQRSNGVTPNAKLQQEIWDHNKAVERRKAEKKALKKRRPDRKALRALKG